MSSRVASVNVALPRTVAQRPAFVSGIDKLPAFGPVAVLRDGLQGDGVANTRYHGGTARAVLAYAAEDLDWWGRELGRPLRPGSFGENLTTGDLDLDGCVMGEQWLVGTARLQVTSVRTPCPGFERWMAVQGLDSTGWEQRFTARGRPGVFLAVLDEGWVHEGDTVEVLERPGHGVTAGVVFRAVTTEPVLLPVLLEVEGLPPAFYDKARRYAATGEF